MKKVYLSITLLLGIFVWSCSKDTTSGCGTTTYKYSTEISVIFNNKCNTSGCHNVPVSGVAESFTSVANIKKHSDHILEEIAAGTMPKSGSPALTADEKAKIKSWIDACCPDN